jgi:cytoskeletal protein CcmA (bactofilin family)
MFNKKKQPAIKSLISIDSCVEGSLRFSAGLRIDGELIGNVQGTEGAPSLLVISESATVSWQIRADHVIINGHVIGPVHAVVLELQPKARVEGDVFYTALEMHQGAMISGMLTASSMGSAEPMLKLEQVS